MWGFSVSEVSSGLWYCVTPKERYTVYFEQGWNRTVRKYKVLTYLPSLNKNHPSDPATCKIHTSVTQQLLRAAPRTELHPVPTVGHQDTS